MIILDGKKLADRILDELKRKVVQMKRPPVLVIITVNSNEATKSYLRAKKIAAERVGIGLRIRNYDDVSFRRKQESNQEPNKPGSRIKYGMTNREIENKIIQDIKNLNDDPAVDAIMVQLPLPPELDRDKILSAIAPHKDVEKEALTPKAILRLLDEYKISVKGKQVVIVGAGFLVGKPLVKLMKEKGAKVTMLGLMTGISNKQPASTAGGQVTRICPKPLVACRLPLVTREADILVSCCGDPNSIKKEMIKPGAVVIDCGSPEGDVDCEKISKIASAITPVPGGVGPMTVATLMEKTVRLCYNKINASN